MKKILAHSEKDAAKRRASFEERYRYYSGHQYTLKGIKQAVNARLEIKYLRFYLSESNKYSNEPNPIVSFTEGQFSFSEQGFRASLKKKGADMKLFKMEVLEEERNLNESLTYCPEHLFIYNKRKNVFTQVCTLTYKGIQMVITRWNIKGSPYGLYEIIPAKEMVAFRGDGTIIHEPFVLREDEFYVLDLPTLLMDLALDHQLREEEIAFHAKQMHIAMMETAVMDEEHISLAPIEQSDGRSISLLVRPWMDAIQNYLERMTGKYRDTFYMCNMSIEPERYGGMVSLYGRHAKHTFGHAPREIFAQLCEQQQVEATFTVDETKHLNSPTRRQTVACFKVGGYEMICDELLYHTMQQNDLLTIYPNAKDRRLKLEIHGSIGMHALVGYLKQMPELCRQMEDNLKAVASIYQQQ